MEGWESPVERAIREAQERGEFDNLPGAGKPLRNLGSAEVDDLVEQWHQLRAVGAKSPPGEAAAPVPGPRRGSWLSRLVRRPSAR